MVGAVAIRTKAGGGVVAQETAKFDVARANVFGTARRGFDERVGAQVTGESLIESLFGGGGRRLGTLAAGLCLGLSDFRSRLGQRHLLGVSTRGERLFSGVFGRGFFSFAPLGIGLFGFSQFGIGIGIGSTLLSLSRRRLDIA